MALASVGPVSLAETQVPLPYLPQKAVGIVSTLVEPIFLSLGNDVIQCGENHYNIVRKKFNGGDVKSLYFGYHDRLGSLAISKFCSDKSRPFQPVPEDILRKCQTIARQNKGGGLGVIHDFVADGPTQYIVQDFYTLGNLWDHIFIKDDLTLTDRAYIALDIYRALLRLENEGIVHGEVKAQNIQLHSDGKQKRAFLIDLDLAHYAGKEKVLLGAPITWAPEIYAQKNPLKISKHGEFWSGDTKKATVWSLGMIFLMLFVKNPNLIKKLDKGFQTGDDFIRKKGAKDTPKTYKLFENWLKWKKAEMIDPKFELLRPVLENLLQPNPDKRCNLQEIQQELESLFTPILGN